MPKVEARIRWDAEVELQIENMALAAQYIEKGHGSENKRYLTATDWLDQDGKTIVLDVGKRLKGWLKEVVKTMKPTMADRVNYGLAVKSLPTPGYVPVASIDQIRASKSWKTFQHKDKYVLNGLPEPEVEVIVTKDPKKPSIFALHYVLEKPVTTKAVIYCLGATGFRPDAVKGWLETLGPLKGLGDLHNSGFGYFTVKDFKVVNEVELKF
jgi:hypothetical protein